MKRHGAELGRQRPDKSDLNFSPLLDHTLPMLFPRYIVAKS